MTEYHPCETENGNYLHKGTCQTPWICSSCGLKIEEPIVIQFEIRELNGELNDD